MGGITFTLKNSIWAEGGERSKREKNFFLPQGQTFENFVGNWKFETTIQILKKVAKLQMVTSRTGGGTYQNLDRW